MKFSLISLTLSLLTCYCVAQGSWHNLPNNGLFNTNPTQRYEDVYFIDSLLGFGVSIEGRIFKTTNGGASWKVVNDTTVGKPFFRSIEFLDDKLTGIAGTLDSPATVLRTTDGGSSWTNIQAAIQDNMPTTTKFICGQSHYANTFFAVGAFYSTTARFYKSTNKGVTWQTTYLDTSLISSAIDVVFTSADTGFIAGGYNARLNGGLTVKYPVVIKTVNGGLSWTRVFMNASFDGNVWKLQALSNDMIVGAIEPLLGDTVAMVRTINGGQSWSVIGTGYSKGLPFQATQGIGFLNPQHGFLGGHYAGMVETKDGGLTWDTVAFGRDLNRFFVLDSTHMFAGGQSVYFYGKQVPNGVAPRNFPVLAPHHLYPVSPNPGRGNAITIRFDLLSKTNFSLSVYSLSAKRLWPLTTRNSTSGHYEIVWDASDAPAGNYLILLETNEIPLRQKFTLVK